MLEVSDLSAHYPEFTLGPIDLRIEEGAMSSLVGVNGAGKSTLFRCIMATVKRTQGQVTLQGVPVGEQNGAWKQQIGYVGDYRPFFEHWTGTRNLKSVAPFYENWSEQKVLKLASMLNLNLDRAVRSYSSGERTKLAIIAALAHTPQVLLLDEPTTGLDALAREAFLEVLQLEMTENPLCVLYATQHVSEVERLVDELIFISDGKKTGQAQKDTLEEAWRRVSFQSGAVGNIPGQVARLDVGLHHEVITSDGRAACTYLEQLGAEAVQATRLTLEEICSHFLKEASRA